MSSIRRTRGIITTITIITTIKIFKKVLTVSVSTFAIIERIPLPLPSS